MEHPTYYLISPRPELVERLRRSASPGLSDLSDPVMWSGVEYDRGILQHSDFELLAKLLFLDVLRRERCQDEAFDAVFKGAATTVEYFDSLWSLSRVPIDMTVDDALADAMATGTIGALAKAGNDRVRRVLALEEERRRAKAR